MMRPFCYDQLTNSDGGAFSNVGGTSAREKNYGKFFQAISFNNGPNTDCVA